MPSLTFDRDVGPRARLRLWTHAPASGPRPKPAVHDALELAWIDEGCVAYDVAGERIEVSAGEAIVIPEASVHTTHFDGTMRGGALHLSGELVAEIHDVMRREMASLRPGHGLLRDARRVITLARVVQEEMEAGAPGALVAARSLVDAIAVEMLRQSTSRASLAPEAPRDRRIARALEHLHASYGEVLGVDELAKTAKMSRFHFTRVFRDEVGEAPYQYLQRVRIARAHELLRAGRCSVTEVALAVGFRDFSRFARTFRAHTGKLPGEVLRAQSSASPRRHG